MKVSDILRVKGNTLFTVTPDQPLADAVNTMATHDIGSLVVMDHGTEIDEVRRMMLGRHARYMPVLNEKTLMGVISFYDVARTVVEAQDFENRMLKAYIRDWPVEEGAGGEQQTG